MAREILGSFEYQILAILIQKPGDAYGTTIRERIEEQTGGSVSVGALYTTLDRLEKKGFVSSRWGDATPARGGRRKRFYKVDAAGLEAVQRSEALLGGFIVGGQRAAARI